ncbi:DNAJ protein JJJ1-like protein [Cucumis melo var. makuwa]|uniref:DNAJ protein JJJ1-like protein n=2 Tax=Cucumis melo TaxID=3656 RepID=A0A5A7US56_CUCMM|nr:DNAJ protein JJJ1 homolog [Cucumis melo]KAA0057990.1 DNAJ protein JJJ1-like protein [Cucumis melo var. makuwa]
MASAKRCHYEVLGLHIDCTADEIRSAYRKLALQRHPDKLVQSGLSQADATAQFQELQHAYEVLSDPKERAWYDSHRSQILFSDAGSVNSSSAVPNLFPFFSNTVYSGYSDSGRGFYKIYSDLFDKIYGNEINFAKKLGLRLDMVREAPVMGNLDSPYTQVTAFYNYWLGFCTVMDFCWADQYDVMAGPNRKSRRLMEEDNKKLRKKAKREYNETVRGLAEFVKKRDKRVIDMAMKRNMEMEKKKEEERERKKRLEREKMEKLRTYEEPDWAKVEEVEEDEEDVFEEENRRGKELYCVLCGKKFKSEKQWKNHEQSKKHKEKVAEFKESLDDEDESEEFVDQGEGEEETTLQDDEVDKLGEEFKESFDIEEEETESGGGLSGSEYNDVHEVDRSDMVGEALGSNDDEERDILEAMATGLRNRKNAASVNQPEASPVKTHFENENDEPNPAEFENGKRGKKSRRAKKKGKGNDEAMNETDSRNYKTNGDDSSHQQDSTSNSLHNDETSDKGASELAKEQRASSKSADRKAVTQNDMKINSRHSSKGKKSKATSKDSGNSCETCGEEFDSRNKLHKHLGATGHASLKYR